MSKRRDLAVEAIGYCLKGVGWITGHGAFAKAAGILDKVNGIANDVAALEADTVLSAAERIATQLEESREFTDEAVATALALLDEQRAGFERGHDLLETVDGRKDYPKALYTALFAKAPPPEENGVAAILRAVIREAYKELRKDDTFDKLFQQEALISLEAGVAEIKTGMPEMEARLIEAVDTITEEKAELAVLRSERAFLISIVRNFVPDAGEDYAGAVASITRALAIAAKQLELGAMPSNTGSTVDDIVAETRRLNRAGDTQGAFTNLMDTVASRRAERERQTAADLRVIDEAILQAEIVNNAAAYAALQLEKIQVTGRSEEAQFWDLFDLQDKRHDAGGQYGAPFVQASAIGLARQCMEIAPSDYHLALAQSNLGVSLQEKGIRIRGEEGTVLLNESLEHLTTAGDAFESLGAREEWALNENNRGNTLQELGVRTAGREAGRRLLEAGAAYKAAAEVYEGEGQSASLAMTMNNAANTLRSSSERSSDPETKVGLLVQAEAAYAATLDLYSEKENPVEVGIVRMNLGTARLARSVLISPEDGETLFAEGEAEITRALAIFKLEDQPLQAAEARKRLGEGYFSWSLMHSTDPASDLETALDHVDAALEVFDPVYQSFDHAAALELRKAILGAT